MVLVGFDFFFKETRETKGFMPPQSKTKQKQDCHIFFKFSVVCDVWYLPPMTRMENEDAVKFANRVKAEIARQGGLVDLVWYVQFC